MYEIEVPLSTSQNFIDLNSLLIRKKEENALAKYDDNLINLNNNKTNFAEIKPVQFDNIEDDYRFYEIEDDVKGKVIYKTKVLESSEKIKANELKYGMMSSFSTKDLRIFAGII